MSVCKFALATACAFFALAAQPVAAQQVTAQWLQGLYLRGDAGWSGSVSADLHDRNPADHGTPGAIGTSPLTDFGSGWLVGGGVGTQFLPNFRADLVYTYRGGYLLDQSRQTPSPTQFRGDVSSHSVMANVYGDIPIGYPGIVPFVGGGIGWSHVKLANFSSMSGGTTVFAPQGSSSNFAWQATAGIGFTVTDGAIVDIFYRYFDGGHVRTDAGNLVSGGSVVGTYHGAEGALHAHEIGLTFRYPLR